MRKISLLLVSSFLALCGVDNRASASTLSQFSHKFVCKAPNVNGRNGTVANFVFGGEITESRSATRGLLATGILSLRGREVSTGTIIANTSHVPLDCGMNANGTGSACQVNNAFRVGVTNIQIDAVNKTVELDVWTKNDESFDITATCAMTSEPIGNVTPPTNIDTDGVVVGHYVLDNGLVSFSVLPVQKTSSGVLVIRHDVEINLEAQSECYKLIQGRVEYQNNQLGCLNDAGKSFLGGVTSAVNIQPKNPTQFLNGPITGYQYDYVTLTGFKLVKVNDWNYVLTHR